MTLSLLGKRNLLPLSAFLLGLTALVGSPIGFAQTPVPTQAAPATNAATTAEFKAAADDMLLRMSEITGLKLKTPLKKTLRSRDEIHAYVIRQMNDEKNPEERYAGQRSAEAFGLLPKNFDLDTFMIDMLTEQIAGLYDPKAHEFYIADWIPLADQRVVMAHELTHALEDQHFSIETWSKAARPNDDAELAREAVLEGSAMAAMMDYILGESGHSLKDLPDIDPSLLAGDMSDSPLLKKAPQFMKDALIFPYFGGLTFSAAVLKNGGWSALPEVFAKPPVSTQQILHPDLYRTGHAPTVVTLPAIDKNLGSDWEKLEDNLMGEFGWKEILKQFLGDAPAKELAPAWDGDRYQLYEQKGTKRLALVARLHLSTDDQALKFFEQYSALLQKKHPDGTKTSKQAEFLAFETPDGGVFLRCEAKDCLTVEGTDRAIFDAVSKEISWNTAPETKATKVSTPSSTGSDALMIDAVGQVGAVAAPRN